MIIHSGELGIDSQDVELCENITQLKIWDLELKAVILELENKLINAKYRTEYTGKPANPEWVSNTTIYRNLQEILQTKVKKKMLELSKDDPFKLTKEFV